MYDRLEEKKVKQAMLEEQVFAEKHTFKPVLVSKRSYASNNQKDHPEHE